MLTDSTGRYSQGFVEKLYQFKSGGTGGPLAHAVRVVDVRTDETLGKRWMKLMNRDPLKPVFENYAKFYWRSGSRSGQKPVHFREKNFIRGMDHKVWRSHVHDERTHLRWFLLCCSSSRAASMQLVTSPMDHKILSN